MARTLPFPGGPPAFKIPERIEMCRPHSPNRIISSSGHISTRSPSRSLGSALLSPSCGFIHRGRRFGTNLQRSAQQKTISTASKKTAHAHSKSEHEIAYLENHSLPLVVRAQQGALPASAQDRLTLEAPAKSRFSNLGDSSLYSCLNASIGCTPAARRAGIQLAAKATASKVNTPPIIVAGSHG